MINPYWAKKENKKPTNPYLASNDPTTTIANYEERLARSGVVSPEKPSGGTNNLLMKALDILDRPRNMVASGLEEMFNPEGNKAQGVGQAMMNGLMGKDHVYVNDWLPQNNGDGKLQASELLWGALGFAGDVLLDPLTYTGVGAVKSIGVQGAKKAAVALGKKAFEGSAALAAKAAAQGADDIAKLTGRSIAGRVNASDLDPAVSKALSALDSAKDEVGAITRATRSKLFESLGVDSGRMNANILGLAESEVPKYKGYAAKFRQAIMKDADLRSRVFGTYDEAGNYVEGEFAKLSKYFTKNYVKAAKAVERGETLSPRTDAFYTANKAKIDKEFSDLMQGIYGEGAVGLDFGNFSVALDIGVKGKRLKELAKDSDNMTKAFKNMGAKRTEVTYINGLQKIVDHSNKSWHFKFMGKPLFTAEPVHKAASFVGEKVYKRLPRQGQKAVDSIISVFDPHYVSLAAKAEGDVTFDLLKKAEEETTRQVAKSAGIVDRANAFVTSSFSIDNAGKVDHTLLTDERLAKSMGYYVEAEQATMEIVRHTIQEAKKAIGDPEFNPAELLTPSELKLRHLTVDKFAEVMKTHKLTPEDLNYLRIGADRFAASMAAIAGADEGLGVMYDGARGYFPHFYDKDILGTRNVAAMYQTKSTVDELSGMLANAEQRDFYSMAHAEASGLKPVTDYRSVAGLRYMDSQRVYLHKEFIDTLSNLTAVGKTAKGNTYRARIFHTKQNATRNLQKISVPGFENYYADPEVIRQIQRMRNVFISNESFMETLRYFDMATNVIKKLQTSLSPSFVARNAVGETFMNFMAGVGVGSHITAGKVIADTAKSHTFLDDTMFVHRGKPLVYIHTENGKSKLVRPDLDVNGNVIIDPNTGKPRYHDADKRYVNNQATSTFVNEFEDISKNPKARKALQEELRKEARALLDDMDEGQRSPKYKLGGKEYYAFEIQDMMRMGGLKHSGMTRGNLVEGFEAKIKQSFSPTKAFKVWDALPKVADTTETYTRMAHLIQRLDDGYDMTDAVRDVKKYHVDYKDLTPVERGALRRVMPYYTYMRKNTPIQLRLLMEHPAAFTSIGRLTNQMYENMDNPEAPDYLERNMAIPIGRNGDDVTYLNLNMPMNDVGRVQFERDQLIKENVIDMLHPAIKSLFELHTNQSLTFGTPIERYEGENAEIIKGLSFTSAPKEIDYFLQQMGVLNQLRMFASDVAGYQPSTSQGVPLPKQIPMLSSLLPTKNVQQVQAGEAYDRRDQLADYIKKTEADGTPVMTYDELRDLRKSQKNRTFKGYIPPTPTI